MRLRSGSVCSYMEQLAREVLATGSRWPPSFPRLRRPHGEGPDVAEDEGEGHDHASHDGRPPQRGLSVAVSEGAPSTRGGRRAAPAE
jgi:hypothetical protein